MVSIEEFISGIERAFEKVQDIKKGSLRPDSQFRDHFAWDSINALIFIAHVQVEYDVEITADDLGISDTAFSLCTERRQ